VQRVSRVTQLTIRALKVSVSPANFQTTWRSNMKALRISTNIALGCLLAVSACTMASAQEPGRGAGAGAGSQGSERSGAGNSAPGRAGNRGAGKQSDGNSEQGDSESDKGSRGQEVSARRRAAIEAWKATGKSGPPPWAGKGGGPGGNPNRKDKDQKKGDKRKALDKD
jgi:hypothetical protein